MIFETHAHYDDDAFDEDREELLDKVHAFGVSPIVNVAASIGGTKSSMELARTHSYLYAAVGVHPDSIEELDEEQMLWLKEMAAWEKSVAIGEIGLDYYWHKEPEVQEKQRYWFGRQLELARETGLPVIIHSRDAAEDTMRVMKEHRAEEIPGIVHCYSYSPEMALEFVKMGFFIGVGGVVTFKNAKKLVRTVEAVPIEHIVVETDCPYLAPEPNRGKRNDSRNIAYVIRRIAEIKGMTPEDVERITEENGYRLYTKIRKNTGEAD